LPFKTILRELVETTHGANGAILADWEGEAVEQYCLTDAFELKVTAAHKGIILNQLKDILVNFPSGDLRYAVITTESQHVIVGVVGADYSLIMTLDRDAVTGLALRRFNSAVQLLVREIY